jgi:hypothetical protein
MNCRPGDLAIVVRAENKQNLGRIVHVVQEHDGAGDLVLDERVYGHVWLVEAERPLVWRRAGKRVRRRRGPAPDDYLLPVGSTPSESTAPATSDVSTDTGADAAEEAVTAPHDAVGAIWHP